jgi:hypothetical protein
VLDGGRLNGLDPEGSSREIASLTNITGGEDVVGAALQARADEHALVQLDSRAVKKIDVRAHTRGADHQVGGQRLAVVRGDTQGGVPGSIDAASRPVSTRTPSVSHQRLMSPPADGFIMRRDG